MLPIEYDDVKNQVDILATVQAEYDITNEWKKDVWDEVQSQTLLILPTLLDQLTSLNGKYIDNVRLQYKLKRLSEQTIGYDFRKFLKSDSSTLDFYQLARFGLPICTVALLLGNILLFNPFLALVGNDMISAIGCTIIIDLLVGITLINGYIEVGKGFRPDTRAVDSVYQVLKPNLKKLLKKNQRIKLANKQSKQNLLKLVLSDPGYNKQLRKIVEGEITWYILTNNH